MAIEVKEISVRIKVSQPSSVQPAKQALTAKEKSQIINECVSKILEKLEDRKER